MLLLILFTVSSEHTRSFTSTYKGILMSWCHEWQETTMWPRYTIRPVYKKRPYGRFI